MTGQLTAITEAWLCLELNEEIRHDNSSVWEKAENLDANDPEALKRWFVYAQENKTIPQHMKLEIFTIPNPENFEGDELLVLYQEGQLWSGFSLSRLTAFSGKWSKKGVSDFADTLFPESRGLEVEYPFGSDAVGLLPSDEARIKELRWEDLDDDYEDDEDYEEASQAEFDEQEDDSLDDSWPESDTLHQQAAAAGTVETSHSVEDDDRYRVMDELLETLETQLDQSIVNIEECVEEAIQLIARQQGSKKLVRLILNVEEDMSELKRSISASMEAEEV